MNASVETRKKNSLEFIEILFYGIFLFFFFLSILCLHFRLGLLFVET